MRKTETRFLSLFLDMRWGRDKKCAERRIKYWSLAEAVRFELTDPCESTVFKTVAIDHSATLPSMASIVTALTVQFVVSMPRFSMKVTTSARPSRVFRLVITQGRVSRLGRMRSVSARMT